MLSLGESHILEDVNKCIIALRDQDADNLDRAAGAIRGRAARLAHIVTGEMDSYEPGAYTEGVMRNVNFLTSTGKSQSPVTAALLLIFESLWLPNIHTRGKKISACCLLSNRLLHHLIGACLLWLDDLKFISSSKYIYWER
ncbi:catenin (cadherin-associated protein) alpha [Lynx pardinus]|uniref:Catenin (Cadherin-associated protein) alpha n=1 Tax=Lynx pardinus TaxID=191816 RepID=A0A485PJ15_LYNPA|nr:catenin (cadherin-associated protein) alpha [Lynx pardinus]